MASKCTNESNVWQHMEKIGNSKAQCRLCLRQLASLAYIHNDVTVTKAYSAHRPSTPTVGPLSAVIPERLAGLARCLPLWEGRGVMSSTKVVTSLRVPVKNWFSLNSTGCGKNPVFTSLIYILR